VDDLERRFGYHPPPNAAVGDQHAHAREIVRITAGGLLSLMPDEPRERALVLTKLEEALFWANAAIARHHAKD
jgi:hypothetical protein